MFITPTLSISCITCMQQQGEEGGDKEHESDGKLRLTGVVPAPFGGAGGSAWDDGMYNGVKQITVASGFWIDSIHVAYDNNGELVKAEKHGGDGGSTNPQINLMYPDEFLVSVSGTYFEGLIRSLKFESNKRTFGPFGIEYGTAFEFTVADGGQIVGMKGRSGIYLDAIGVHISRAPKRRFFRRVKESLKRLSSYDILSKITKPLSMFQCTCLSL